MLNPIIRQRMNRAGQRALSGRAYTQTGMTLIELMISMVISLIASLAMVILMANTLSTGTHTIQMTRLTQEMRSAMHIITRDLRRANFHANSMNCYGSVTCTELLPDIKAITPEGGDCFRFWYDRLGDGDLDAGAFQLFTRDGVNVVQMTTVDTATVSCDDDWGVSQDITDPDILTVTTFAVSNAESYNEIISEDGDTQDVSKVRLTMTASLLNTPAGIPITRTIEDMIYVRNNVFCPLGTCP